MSKIKLMISILLIFVIIVSSGCVVSNQTPSANTPDINPKAEAANKDTSDVALYFSYRGENFLAGETRTVDVAVNETLEKAVVRELIEGPSADRDELVGLFWQGVSLVGVDTNDDVIFVTLSKDFVSTNPSDGEMALEDVSVQEQKKLAINSIVNTIIEMGKYSRVQIYVNRQGDIGQRITRSEAGWSENGDAYLEPLYREQSLVLTPENTLIQALDSFAKKDWTRLYTFTAYSSPDGTQKPSLDEFSKALAQPGNVLEPRFSVTDSNVAYDGQSVVVMLDYSIKTREGNIISKSFIPVKLVREEDIWKLAYTSLVAILINI